MQPLQDLLHRITWDAAFGAGQFALGYYDRVAGRDVVVPFASIHIDTKRRSLAVLDEDGICAHIPFHRVRTVYKDAAVIWQRPDRPAAGRRTSPKP